MNFVSNIQMHCGISDSLGISDVLGVAVGMRMECGGV